MPATAEPDDTLQRFCVGEQEAVASVRQWIASVVRLPSWGFDDADDLIQEIQLRLLRIARSGGYRGESTLKTFVISVAKHACVDAYRRRQARRRLLSAVDAEPAAAAGAGEAAGATEATEERIEALRYIFQRLPEGCRELWRWVYWQGLSAQEVATRLGITAGSARVRLHRCLERARALGAELVPGEETP